MEELPGSCMEDSKFCDGNSTFCHIAHPIFNSIPSTTPNKKCKNFTPKQTPKSFEDKLLFIEWTCKECEAILSSEVDDEGYVTCPCCNHTTHTNNLKHPIDTGGSK